ncbi:hypothetical protein GPJ56_002944 [Histomonas meleagridis]|uniref:uncharacterized protein n=1 Tax=Histomonas meleagridis TaxID=135588 RepID=UPI003559ADFC|nr:hypothetical protein GPJ56_002944 [Histomonas meleagridis]KAH0796603.1 hypothetical protein GO595_010496 [Histomonas meleagridis]
MSLVQAKAFAARIHAKLVPIEEDVYKFEDVALCLKKVKSIVLYLSVNIIFLLIYLLHLPPMSLIAIIVGLWALLPYYKSILEKLIRKFILGKKVKTLAPDAPRKRYDIGQISAFCGTIYYIIENQVASAKNGLNNKNIMNMGLTFFALNFIFYLFLSFPGALIMWILINGIMLLPLILQNHIKNNFHNLRNRLHGHFAHHQGPHPEMPKHVIEREAKPEAVVVNEEKKEADEEKKEADEGKEQQNEEQNQS